MISCDDFFVGVDFADVPQPGDQQAALAEGVLSTGAQKKLKEAIWNLEDSDSVRKLMALMKADIQKKTAKIRSKVRSRMSGKKRRKPLFA